MRLTWGGVLVYAGMTMVLVVQTVRLILIDQLWADGIAVTSVFLVGVGGCGVRAVLGAEAGGVLSRGRRGRPPRALLSCCPLS